LRHEDIDDEPYDDDSREPREEDETDSDFQTEAEVTCPYCSEVVLITIDPNGGVAQEYVEDCQVCCRPWNVQVSFDEMGAAEVTVEAQ
jgi:hypothetical protein